MPINTEGKKPPLFIVHGDNSNYIISDHLGPDQPVYGFFHPGSEGEAIPYKSVKEMAGDYLSKLLTVSPKGPYFLIGFSFGGLLAFEMAVQLQKAGHNVPFLVLIDSFSPLAREPIKWHKSLYMIIRKNLLRPVRIKLKRKRKLLICNLYLLMKKPIPVERRKDYMFIKYMKFTKEYSPDKFDGTMLLFRTTENMSSYRCLGWETLVNDIRLIEIGGKHLEIFTDKNRSDVLRTEIEKHLSYVSGLN
jgi:thioesterase domain-containing protein